MIIHDIKKISSSKKELFKFSLTIGIILIIFGTIFLLKNKDYYYYLFIASAIFILSGIFQPLLLKPLQKAWMTIAIILGWISTRIMLTFIFYLVISPIGLIAKLFRKNFLDSKVKKTQSTYWNDREDQMNKKTHYEKQY